MPGIKILREEIEDRRVMPLLVLVLRTFIGGGGGGLEVGWQSMNWRNA